MPKTTKEGNKQMAATTGEEKGDTTAILLQFMQQQAIDRQRWEDDGREERRQADERIAQILQAMQGLNAGNAVAPINAAQATHAAHVQPQILRPPSNVKLLSETLNMAEFTIWKKSWEDYALINRVDRHDRETQLAALRTHMSQEFQAIYDESISIVAATPNQPTVDEALNAIQNFVRGIRNIIVDRHDFFTRRQHTGESFEHFFVALRQLSRQADICDHCVDTQLITLIIVGVRDPELQKKLLEIRPAPNLNQVLTVCRAFESAGADQTTTVSNSRYVGAKSKQARHTAQKPMTEEHDKFGQGQKCIWCAGKPHQNKNDCPARDKTCGYCSKKGHFEKACIKQQRDQKKQQHDSMAKKVGTARISRAAANSWDRSIPVLVHAKKNAKLTAFPDTGADINILPVRFLPKLGINKNYLKPPDVTITAYNGERDSPIGFFEAKLTVEESSTLAKIDICAAKNTAIPTRRQDERTIGNCHVPTTHGTSRH